MQIQGSPNLPQMNEVAGPPRLSVSQFFEKCKETGMSAPKAVLSSIKYAFSSQAGKEQKVDALSPQQQSAPAQQVSSQRGAEPNSAPKFTRENSLDKNEWMNACDNESKKYGREGGYTDSPEEAAQYVMKELQSQFPDHKICAMGYLPDLGTSSSLVLGVQIRPKDDEYGTERCIHVLAQTKGEATSISTRAFLNELNRLNQ